MLWCIKQLLSLLILSFTKPSFFFLRIKFVQSWMPVLNKWLVIKNNIYVVYKVQFCIRCKQPSTSSSKRNSEILLKLEFVMFPSLAQLCVYPSVCLCVYVHFCSSENTRTNCQLLRNNHTGAEMDVLQYPHSWALRIIVYITLALLGCLHQSTPDFCYPQFGCSNVTESATSKIFSPGTPILTLSPYVLVVSFTRWVPSLTLDWIRDKVLPVTSKERARHFRKTTWSLTSRTVNSSSRTNAAMSSLSRTSATSWWTSRSAVSVERSVRQAVCRLSHSLRLFRWHFGHLATTSLSIQQIKTS